jgi:hypothetical protein
VKEKNEMQKEKIGSKNDESLAQLVDARIEELDDWRGLKVGDVLRTGNGALGIRVEILKPERVLSNRSEAGDWVWTFVLGPQNGSTRLISRNRIAMKGASAGQRFGMAVMEPGSLVMERKMLRGIKERAERVAAQRRDD